MGPPFFLLPLSDRILRANHLVRVPLLEGFGHTLSGGLLARALLRLLLGRRPSEPEHYAPVSCRLEVRGERSL
jgi:hypothetical protein